MFIQWRHSYQRTALNFKPISRHFNFKKKIWLPFLNISTREVILGELHSCWGSTLDDFWTDTYVRPFMVTLEDQGIMYVVINFKEAFLFWAGFARSSFSTLVTMTMQI
jgi:hypothetical protein